MKTTIRYVDPQRMRNAREAFRLQRLAHRRRHLCEFYLKHNLFDEERLVRAEMLTYLRRACRQWRLALAAQD